jgi:hypothetical protein
MQFYDFEVLKGDEIIATEPLVPLLDTRAAWPKIARMAKRISLPGCRIRVREQSGETIILIGAAAAQRLGPLRKDHSPEELRSRDEVP